MSTCPVGMGESGAAGVGMIVRLDRMANLDLEQTRNQARALLDSRIDSVTALVRSRQRINELRDQLVAAERDDKRAYIQATRDGWSADELKKLGLESAAVKRRRTAKRSDGQEQGAEQNTGSSFSEQ